MKNESVFKTALGLVTAAGIGFSVFLATPAPYVITQAKVETIYNKIYEASGEPLKYKLPIKYVATDNRLNAFASIKGIFVLKGIDAAVKNDDELAFVISHELSHITLRHVLANPIDKEDSRRHEALADKLGAFYVTKAGYNMCNGREFFTHLEELGSKGGGSHPLSKWRYEQLNVGCSK